MDEVLTFPHFLITSFPFWCKPPDGGEECPLPAGGFVVSGGCLAAEGRMKRATMGQERAARRANRTAALFAPGAQRHGAGAESADRNGGGTRKRACILCWGALADAGSG